MKDNAKLKKLQQILEDIGRCIVAFSGGTDSSFLLKVAADTLRKNVIAATILSPTFSDEEARHAKDFASSLGVKHITTSDNELEIPGFSDNPPDRCYLCKRELFGNLLEIARQEGADTVLDASNIDDLSDYRPGRKAAKELGIRSPIVEAGITKKELREISKDLGIATWDKPSMACLASRFPYREKITEEKLKQVAEAEKILRSLGFAQSRLRHHGHIARIEVEPDLIPRVIKPEIKTELIEKLKELGFKYISLDLEGYRTGSLNEVLENNNGLP